VFIKSFPKNFQDRLHEVECDVKVSESSEVGKKKERSLGCQATFTPPSFAPLCSYSNDTSIKYVHHVQFFKR